MTAWKNFLIRAGSAIVALGIIISLYLTLAITGLKIAVAIAVIIGTWELMKLLFQNEHFFPTKACFYAL
jgi:phosphatidate cytidylyltransferase